MVAKFGRAWARGGTRYMRISKAAPSDLIDPSGRALALYYKALRCPQNHPVYSVMGLDARGARCTKGAQSQRYKAV